jgi:hypothetical protein
MRKCVAVVLAASALFLAGCCTVPRASRWEYKVARLPLGGDANRVEGPEAVREAQAALLNDLGKEGWELVGQTDGRIFYFKRPVR